MCVSHVCNFVAKYQLKIRVDQNELVLLEFQSKILQINPKLDF